MSETSENSDFLLKLSLPAFVLLGLSKTTSYYSQFEFPIIEYLNFSEMINLFLSSIYIYTALFFQFGILLFINKRHFIGSIVLLIIPAMLIVLYNVNSGNSRVDTSITLTVFTCVLIVVSILIGLARRYVYAYLGAIEKKRSQAYFFVLIMAALLVISSFQGRFEADNVKKQHVYSGTIVKTKSETLMSNDVNYFIGKTENFIFFYDEKQKQTNIYPVSEVEKIIYKVQNHKRY